MELGRAVRGATVTENGSWISCHSPHPVALSNFAIDLTIQGDEAALKDSMRALCAEALLRPSFRVFRLPLDEPADIDAWLSRSGFAVQNSLVHMVGGPVDRKPSVDPRPCKTRGERRMVAGFATSQFFVRRDSLARALIVGCTANSPHELLWLDHQGVISAALMLVNTGDALGLYNLCVDSKLRGRGLGRELVLWAQDRAKAQGVPLVLQCEASLEPWYASLGFQKIGIQESWGLK